MSEMSGEISCWALSFPGWNSPALSTYLSPSANSEAASQDCSPGHACNRGLEQAAGCANVMEHFRIP